MNIYGKRVLDAIDKAERLDIRATIVVLGDLTGFRSRYVTDGISEARRWHLIGAVPPSAGFQTSYIHMCCKEERDAGK